MKYLTYIKDKTKPTKRHRSQSFPDNTNENLFHRKDKQRLDHIASIFVVVVVGCGFVSLLGD